MLSTATGQPKVGDLDSLQLVFQHHVAGLEISRWITPCECGRRQARSDLESNADHIADLQLRRVPQAVTERLSPDEFHHQNGVPSCSSTA